MTDNLSFTDFYKRLGLNEYPFAHWSAEQEERRSDLFIKPTFYGPIDEKFRSGAGMFLVGERGTGKTAALYDLSRSSKRTDLLIDISSFSEISANHNPTELYRLIAGRITEASLKWLADKPFSISRISYAQRLLLSYAFSEFTSPTTKGELKQTIERIQSSFMKRFVYKAYAIIRYPLNITASFAATFLSELVSKSVGLNKPPEANEEVKQFFPDIPFRIDDSFNSLPASLRLVTRLAEVAIALGATRVIVIIDKLDEDPRLEGDAESIAEFVRGVVSETSLHLSDTIQIISSIWSVPFGMLQKTGNIRTQKMNIEYLTWDRLSLERALNNRLSVYSAQSVSDYKRLFFDDFPTKGFDLIFELANKNPRDLWHALDYIMKEAYRIDPRAARIAIGAVEGGLRTFVADFNYYEYYPRRANARANSMDVYAYIRHLLRLSSVEFTRNQLTERSGVSGGSANNYVQGMENMGLISSKGQTGGNVNYIIRDPKIRYALEKGIDISIN